MDSYALQQLATHRDDRYYDAAFYNGLTGPALSKLLMTADDVVPGDQSGLRESRLFATTLATAYASDTLSAGVKSTLAEWLMIPRPTFYPEFMTALADNKEAALSFTSSLTGTQFYQLARGAGGGDVDQSQVMFINVCTAALSAVSDPSQARSLMDKLSSGLTSTQPRNMDAVIRALTPLMVNFYSVYFKTPPVFSGPAKGDELDQWIQQHDAQYAGDIAGKFSNWIYTTEGANESSKVFLRQLVENTAVAGAFVFPPLAVADGAALGVKVTVAMLEAAAGGWGTAYLDGAVFSSPDPQDEKMRFNYAQSAYAQMLITSQLLAQGQLTYGPGQESVAQAAADQHVPADQILNWLMNHPYDVHIPGTGQNLENILTLVSDQYYHNLR
jgi:hypothetical protein